MEVNEREKLQEVVYSILAEGGKDPVLVMIETTTCLQQLNDEGDRHYGAKAMGAAGGECGHIHAQQQLEYLSAGVRSLEETMG
jgi:hypothetical protein